MHETKLFVIVGFAFESIPLVPADFTLEFWLQALVHDHIMALLDGRTPSVGMDFRIIDCLYRPRFEPALAKQQTVDWFMFELPQYPYHGTVVFNGTFDAPELNHFKFKILPPPTPEVA